MRTTHVVHTCVQRPLLLMWVDRTLLMSAVFLATLIYAITGFVIGGLLVFVVLYTMSYWLTKKDPHAVAILRKAWRQPTRFDAGKR